MARPVRHRGKWRIRWIDENGGRRSAVFADFREAEHQLRQRHVEVEEIRRGLRSAAPPEKTFDELCDYWLAKRAILKRSRDDDESIIRRHLRPTFGALKLREIGVELIDGFVATRRHLASQTIVHHLTLLGTMLRAAVELEQARLWYVGRMPNRRELAQRASLGGELFVLSGSAIVAAGSRPETRVRNTLGFFLAGTALNAALALAAAREPNPRNEPREP